MHEVSQQQKQTSPNQWHGSDKAHTVAQLEKALELDPRNADQWCRLGELYDALATDASDEKTASAHRDKAIVALMQALSLSPGFAKAHYALAGVYGAIDKCLALVELEAAAKCDPEAYGGAFARAQKAVRNCTYRLGDLDIVARDSAQAQPGPEILQAEFYFEERPVRSAVLSSCVSEGSLQSAKFWLFESADPVIGVDEPVAQLAVSSTGNVFLSRGSPANYPRRQTIPVSAPPRAQSGRSVVLPVGLMIVAFGGSLFAYLNLFAPAASTTTKAPVSAVAAAPAAISEATPPAANDAPFEPPPASVSAALSRLASNAPEITATPQVEPPRPVQRPVPSAPAPMADRVRPEPPAPRPVDPPIASPRQPDPPIASPRPAAPPIAAPRAIDPPVGSSAAQIATAEIQAVPREVPPVTSAPSVPQQPASAPPPGERVALREAPVVAPSIPKPAPAVVAPSIPKPTPAPENNWTTRLRAELDACGKPGYLRSDLCREATRWNYCHPDRWGTVRECAVERFASTRPQE